MALPLPKDLKSEMSLRPAIIPGATGPTASLVANSGVAMSTNQSANLAIIDRQGESTWPSGGGTGGPTNADLAQSAVFSLQVDTGANTPVLTSCTANIETSSDQVTWAAYVPPTVPGLGSNPGALVAGTACGLATQLGCTVLGPTGIVNIAVDLSGSTCKRYIRINPKPTFSGGSSTVFVESYCALGGFAATPVQTPTNP
jgi:hypothetical protein